MTLCQSAVKQAVMQNTQAETEEKQEVSVRRETGGHAEHHKTRRYGDECQSAVKQAVMQNTRPGTARTRVSVRRETGGHAEQK